MEKASDTVESNDVDSQPLHMLNDSWNYYCHMPNETSWTMDSYKLILGNIRTAEDAVLINEALTPKIIKNCMLFLFRDGIQPSWEDKKNMNNGAFSFKVSNVHAVQVWKQLFYATVGETLTTSDATMKHVNGITISPKKNFCIMKVWMDTTSIQDPNVIKPIANLTKQGCMFKSHNDKS